jgi:N-acetylmuramoyl-L-alanine amidase
LIDWYQSFKGLSVFRFIVCFLFFTSTLPAQNSVDAVRPSVPLARQLLGGDTLFLRVQRPDQDTVQVFSSHYRIAGCTSPNARAFVDGKQTKVYASGAFVGLEAVNVGINILRFTVKSAAGDSIWKDFVITRPEPMKNSPHDTLVIEQAMMEPSQDVWLGSGDVLEVRFKGSPDWEASFDIPGIKAGIPMHELAPREAGGFKGIYVGHYEVKPTDQARDVSIRFRLRQNFWNSERAYSNAKVFIIPGELPRVAEVIGDRPYLNAGLGEDRLNGTKLGFIQPGVRVEISGKVGPYYRVRLSGSMNAWLPEEFAKFLPSDTPLPRSLAGAISAVGNESEDIVTLALSARLPYTSEQLVDPAAIAVNVYGVTSNTNWISHQLSAKGIENITWEQIATDQYRMVIVLRHPHWGYDIDYVGNSLRVKVRRPPVLQSRDSVLAGLTIAVDAGHGGDNKGSIGATGALEKDINISIALHLESILKAKHAGVVLTRTETDIPSMAGRIDRILNSDARLLVSIHCNSAGDASDPLMVQGVSTYYRSVGFKPLADIIYDKMLAIGLQQFGVVGGFNFTLNSLTQLPNVLVETAFLSHPEDEMLLLDDGFRKKIAGQIAAGLEEFVKSQAEMKESKK